MSELLEAPGGQNGESLVSASNAQIDMYFQIHEKVNARSEETQKSYKNNILVSFNDIRELHLKTLQSIKALQPAKSIIGVRISVLHNEGEADKFNSFESFEAHNTTSPNPTSSINFVYSFTLYDQESGEFERYKIYNQISSRIAELKQLEKEAPSFVPKEIIASIVTNSAKIKVEYTDYVKARHFIAMFDEWIKSCDETTPNVIIGKLKSTSHLITKFGVLAIYALLAYSTIKAINTKALNPTHQMEFLIAYASIFVICGGVAESFLRKMERSIDLNIALSYLNINKGDAKLIREYSNRNKKNITWALIGLAGTIVISLISSAAYDLIKWLIT